MQIESNKQQTREQKRIKDEPPALTVSSGTPAVVLLQLGANYV